MKNIDIKIKVLSLMLIIMSMTACEDFLVEVPRSNLSPENFYSTVGEANSAVLGIYEVLDDADFHGQMGIIGIGDHGADLTQRTAITMIEKDAFQGTYLVDPGNSNLLNFYESNYNMIMRANTAINRIQAASFDEAKKAEFIGEAKFLRALSYFYLVRTFGPVVLVTTEPTDIENFARVQESEVYTQIVNDLMDAEISLADKIDMERASKWAAKALLAKVYLTMGEATNAAAKAKEVIDAPQNFALHTDYGEVFDLNNKSVTDEIIFAASYGPARRTNLHDFLTPQEVSAYGAIRAEESLFNFASYEAGDLRSDESIYADSVFSNGAWVSLPENYIHFLKFGSDMLVFGIPEGQAGLYDYPILRYADVLLTYAEALNAANSGPTSEAYGAIDEVRERAGLPALSRDKTFATFVDAILQERKVEFVLEGHRWFDLKRLGKLEEVMSFYRQWKPLYSVFPIPETAIQANPALVQTEGY